jgi:hypothetical protein
MNTTFACVFPETQPDAGLLFPLLQVFDRVVHMQAVENEPIETRSPFIQECVSQGRLQGFTPVPLGEQRQRFMALVEDMRRHGAEYISQLGMLTLAGLHGRGDQQESSHALVADLLRRTDIREREADNLLLWQSRLVLKLGEWHDRQQAEITSTLDHIAARQDALLKELREEEDNPFSLTAELADVSREADILLQNRLKAWCRLFGYATDSQPMMAVTAHASAMDLLVEIFESRHRTPTMRVGSLELPLTAAEPLGEKQRLVDLFPELGQTILQLAGALATDQVKERQTQLVGHGDRWRRLLDHHFPPQTTGRCRLELIFFPGISCRNVLLEGFAGGRIGSDKEELLERGCCLGLLQAS